MEAVQTPLCPTCASSSTRRIRREGFFQVSILPFFRIYPWECTSCREPFHRSNRGKLKHERAGASEARLPPTA